MIMFVYRSSCKVPLLCHCTESGNLKTDFGKFGGIEFHRNWSSGSRVVPCERTDRHDEAIIRFSQFCERPSKLNVLPTQCIFVFCMDLRTNSEYFPLRHYLPIIYNPDTVCLQRGTR
jgi:hypothetical protein